MRNSMSLSKQVTAALARPPRKLPVLAVVVLLCSAYPSNTEAAAGDLDPTFGSGGKVTTDFDNSDQANDLAIQSDGKIVAAGLAIGVGLRLVVTRYNTDGGLDPSFGTGGKSSPT